MDMRKLILLLSGALLAGVSAARPVWKAPAPDAQSVVTRLADGASLRVDVLAENLFRVRRSWTNDAQGVVWTESGMNRYGILKGDWPKTPFVREGNAVRTAGAVLTVDPAQGTLRVKGLASAAAFAVSTMNISSLNEGRNAALSPRGYPVTI